MEGFLEKDKVSLWICNIPLPRLSILRALKFLAKDNNLEPIIFLKEQ